ncbi:amidase [Actinomycetospora endophytica]|uniref:Amidase n=1 Tax=Actinomycetospora endophytica TaxID=2291215 RepID=A0ABS8PHZ4_9PSEU|nr:amidase [Actinomycetospora endophytica]MCD2197880.1 amidase [Actinomycetospora endophytica]
MSVRSDAELREVSAFADDALGDDDAVGLAARLRRHEVSVDEVRRAAAGRIARVDPTLRGLALDRCDEPVSGSVSGALAGVPMLVKENTDVAGWPTTNGSSAYTAEPAPAHSEVTCQLLGLGVQILGSTRMPEFGLNATTEFVDAAPTRNPWNTDYSCGASSGGSAALVASGAVPFAHANDGGGSIRIPAAACGLVGLKPTRGRTALNAQGTQMPINLVSDGVVTRTVRDTAAVLGVLDRQRRNPTQPPIGFVDGPAHRRLRIGLVLESPAGGEVDDETRAAVVATARALEAAGHVVEPHTLAVGKQFVDDFLVYWGLLAFGIVVGGRFGFPQFDPRRLDPLTHGLHRHFLRTAPRRPGFLRRLRKIEAQYDDEFVHHDVLLSPTLAHRTPELGRLHPAVPFDELRERLIDYVGFTPLQNVAGAPAVSLPGGRSTDGLPVGVQLAAAKGDERTLIELAYLLEAERPWPLLGRRR